MTRTKNRPAHAAFAALLIAPALAACSFSVGEIEPVGEDATQEQSSPAEEAPAEAPAESAPAESAPDAAAPAEGAQTVTAEHITVGVPASWESIGDADGWSYVHQLSDEAGGVAGRIGFMPGGSAMTAQESVDWFISQVEGQGATDDNYAPVTTLRDDPNRANTSYTYSSGGKDYVAVVWGLTDENGIPSLVQLSGANDVITQDLVADVDASLDLTGAWEGTAG
jgi:hypothetical protein